MGSRVLTDLFADISRFSNPESYLFFLSLLYFAAYYAVMFAASRVVVVGIIVFKSVHSLISTTIIILL